MQKAQILKEEDAATKKMELNRLKNVMFENAAYPPDWEGRGDRHFEIPFGMFANGNSIEDYGIKHTEKMPDGRPKRIHITERKTTPRQVQNTFNMYREGFNPAKGTFVAVVNAFGQTAPITEEHMARMDPVDRADMLAWEKEVEEKSKSEDPEIAKLFQWLKDNVVRKWVFLVDGNSR
jgi:hypothetical protein